MPNRHFLRSDIFTFVMVYSFYFRLFPLMNQIVNHHLEKVLKYYILGRDEFRNI